MSDKLRFLKDKCNNDNFLFNFKELSIAFDKTLLSLIKDEYVNLRKD